MRIYCEPIARLDGARHVMVLAPLNMVEAGAIRPMQRRDCAFRGRTTQPSVKTSPPSAAPWQGQFAGAGGQR